MLSSRWATLFGIPVGWFAVPLYLGLAALALPAGPVSMPRRTGVRFGSSLVLAAAVYFVGLQAFVLGAFCPICTTIHAVAALGAVLVLRAVRAPIIEGEARRRGLGHVATGLAALVLIAGVALVQGSAGPASDARLVQLGGNGEPVPVEDFFFRPFVSDREQTGLALDGGKVPVADYRLPRLSFGEGDGPTRLRLALLTDWTCPECLEAHKRLHELYASEGAERLPDLELFLLPVFHDPVGREVHEAMLRVHVASSIPECFPTLVEEIVTGRLSPEAKAVRGRIEQLDPATAERWDILAVSSKERFQTAFDLAEAQMKRNSMRMEFSTVPQATAFDAVLVGLPSAGQLEDFLVAAKARQDAFLQSEIGTLRLVIERGCTCEDPDHAHTNEGDHLIWRAPDELEQRDSRRVRAAAAAAVGPSGGAGAKPAPRRTGPTSPQEGGPRLRFDQTELLADPIVMGGKATVTVGFRNEGDEPLEIERIRTGCGCVVVEGWKQTVSPGSSGSFRVTHDSSGKSKLGPGEHVQHVWVGSNSSARADHFYGDQIRLRVPVEEG